MTNFDAISIATFTTITQYSIYISFLFLLSPDKLVFTIKILKAMIA